MVASLLSNLSMLLAAATFEELHDRLPYLNKEVPPHPTPRGNTPEFYTMVRLLASIPLSTTDFPLRLTKDESPDFALQLGSVSIGVEHTEAVAENAVHESKLRAAQGRGAYFVQPAVIGEPRKSRKQLLSEIAANRFPEPMMGDSVERGWVDAMLHFITKKADSAQKPGYAAHDQQWLTIYDNWTAPALKRDYALSLLQKALQASDPFTVFDHVFILTGQMVVELTRGRALLHVLNHCRRAEDGPLAEPRAKIRRVARYLPSGLRCRSHRPAVLDYASADD